MSLRLVLVEKKKKDTPDDIEDDILLGEESEHTFHSELAAAFGNDMEAEFKPRPPSKTIKASNSKSAS
jgi:hypothetical protein